MLDNTRHYVVSLKRLIMYAIIIGEFPCVYNITLNGVTVTICENQ